MNYTQTVNQIILKEKGYVNNSADKGGPTNFGITEKVARLNGYLGDMKDLPLSIAEKIYKMRYIISPGFDRISFVSEKIAEEVIDTGVNMGPATAATILQRLLNAFNANGSKYADIFVDGNIGPASIGALNSFLKWRGKEGEEVLLKALNHIQGARYLDIAEANKSQEAFFYGWIKNRT
jgi:lysozyme family protein